MTELMLFICMHSKRYHLEHSICSDCDHAYNDHIDDGGICSDSDCWCDRFEST